MPASSWKSCAYEASNTILTAYQTPYPLAILNFLAMISRIENLSVNPSIGLFDRISQALGKKLEVRGS